MRLPLFDKPTLDAATAAECKASAMAAVDDRANTRFKTAALEAIHVVASRYQEFTSDAIWHVLPDDIVTHDYRALGPIMRRAQHLGWIVPTQVFRLSDQKSRHRAPVRVWRSVIYG